MTRRGLVLREEAREDVASAAAWYDAQRPGLGTDFVSEARDLFQQIAERPSCFRPVTQEVRRALLHRFPYVVYFSAAAEEVVILAVVHKRRHPDTWRQRIQP